MHCSVSTYQFLEDTWSPGVREWCRAANDLVLSGGEAWLLAAHAGQHGWIKHRLLLAGYPLVGVHLPDTAELRRRLCARFGLSAPQHGPETHEFLLRLWALRAAQGETPAREAHAVLRHPGAWRAALETLDAAGWLKTDGSSDAEVGETIPPLLLDWLRDAQAKHNWLPAIDRELLARASGSSADGQGKPLSILALGWDETSWHRRDLFLAALRAAAPVSAQVFLPAPRGMGRGETLAQDWIEVVATGLGVEVRFCASSGHTPRHVRLIERLESSDFSSTQDAAEALDLQPEMLVGVDWPDQLEVARDWVARWLVETGSQPAARLGVIFPARGATSAAFVRALGREGIAVEDKLGEKQEPTLPLQIARALVEYQLDETGIEPLLTLVGLLNDCPACWIRDPHDFGLPLEPVALRRALADAFVELQHRSARLLVAGPGFARSALAGPLGRLVAFLDRWPEQLPWAEARARWENCLLAFKLDPVELLPLWGRLPSLLPADEAVPTRAFFEYLRDLISGMCGLARTPSERLPFARVVVTDLPGAGGQTWDGALFLDCNEGNWPRPHAENPCLDDRLRAMLNARRAAGDLARSHLPTAGDRARLELGYFYEVLENCSGPIAFASVRRAPDDATRDGYPNEWSLRCWVEAASAAERRADHWLERWRRAAVRIERPPPALAKREASHLSRIFRSRCDPAIPFDEYFFDYHALAEAGVGELPLEGGDQLLRGSWTARQLEDVLLQPATFALEQIFDVRPWRDGAAGLARAESAAVGRLTHRWVRLALGGNAEPQPLSLEIISDALARGLAEARRQDETGLLHSLAGSGTGKKEWQHEVPAWWRGVFAKTAWAARGCLEALAAQVALDPKSAAWFCAYRLLTSTLTTPQGQLVLRARPDLLLLDRPELVGASCRVVDLKTGSASGVGATSLAQLRQGRGLGRAAELFLALQSGAEPKASGAAVLHPETSCWDALPASLLSEPEALAALGELARLQTGLRFGQGATRGATDRQARGPSGENLPLACTPLDPAVLRAKAELSGRVG